MTVPAMPPSGVTASVLTIGESGGGDCPLRARAFAKGGCEGVAGPRSRLPRFELICRCCHHCSIDKRESAPLMSPKRTKRLSGVVFNENGKSVVPITDTESIFFRIDQTSFSTSESAIFGEYARLRGSRPPPILPPPPQTRRRWWGRWRC
jgi:hypothetical protein